jgi:CRAL/TRIO domain
LGMIFVANMSRSAEFISSLIMPLLSKEVRNKIHILSSDSQRRAAELTAIVQPEFLPDWLGGTDHHKIDADYYYSQEHFYWNDRESVEFLRTMPYHDVS